MSLSLGQSESYINKIENRHTLPSMAGFFYICEYFGITPDKFFNTDSASPFQSASLLAEFEKLRPDHAEHILQLMKDLNQKNKMQKCLFGIIRRGISVCRETRLRIRRQLGFWRMQYRRSGKASGGRCHF